MQLEQAAATANVSDFLLEVEKTIATLQAERQKGRIVGGIINEGLVQINEIKNLVIVSDLHGDSKSLYQILSDIDFDHFLSNPINKLVFLGDYVDRGSDSIGVVYSICHLKNKYPDSVILMRGNHEAPAEFPFASHDLPYKVEERFGNRGKEVYRRMLSMFRLLSLAVIVRQTLLLVHGGLPTESASLKLVAVAHENQFSSRALEELLWNDPRQLDLEPWWEKSRRGFGRHFGGDISRRWLQASNTKVIVRGHEPCQGFKIDHGDMVLTLFSCKEAYPKFKAAYLILDSADLAEVNNARDLSQYIRFPK